MKPQLTKAANFAKDLYPIAALPLLMFMAIQVYSIAQDNAKKTQEILTLQKELAEAKQTHRNEINQLEDQLNYLIKRLIEKTTTKTPYQFTPELTILKTSHSKFPSIWLPVLPTVTRDRRQLRSSFHGQRDD